MVLTHVFRDVGHRKEMERFIDHLLAQSGRLSRLRNDQPSPPLRGAPSTADLTRREREVLQLLATGASTREIAEKLFISTPTLRNHIHQILYKLGAHSRLEAVTLAIRSSLI